MDLLFRDGWRTGNGNSETSVAEHRVRRGESFDGPLHEGGSQGVAGYQGVNARKGYYLSFTPAALITLEYLSSSVFMSLASSAGVVVTGSAPLRSN